MTSMTAVARIGARARRELRLLKRGPKSKTLQPEHAHRDNRGVLPNQLLAGAPLSIAVADGKDRSAIYGIRHDVYAAELAQHRENQRGELRDALDEFNVYLVAKARGEIVGFISVTPPGGASYSIDKYIPRHELPFECDGGLYEIRLLTVCRRARHTQLAALLMYTALRWVESRGGTRIVAIGRLEVLRMYRKVGLRPLGRRVSCGAVTFELMSATVAELRLAAGRRVEAALRRISDRIDWRLDVPMLPEAPARLSVTTATFQRSESFGPKIRARMSAPVPGV